MDNLEEMNKFLETHNLPRLNEEETDNLNRLITRSEIESVIQKLPANKSLESDCITGEFYQTFKEELIPIYLKLFQKTEKDKTLPDSFYKAPITLTLKADKDTTKKRKLQTSITHEYRCKNPQQNISKLNSIIY